MHGQGCSPSRREFLDTVKTGRIPPVYAEIPFRSPHETYECTASTNSILLESVKGPAKIARYSFIGTDPCLVFKIKNGVADIETSCKKSLLTRKPITVLKALMDKYPQAPHAFLPPFQGGMAGMMSYDFVHYFEKLPASTVDDLRLPDAHFFMMDRIIAFDHAAKLSWVIVCPGLRHIMHSDCPLTLSDWSAMYDEAEDYLRDILKKLLSPIRPVGNAIVRSSGSSSRPCNKCEVHHEMTKKDYTEIVKRVKAYIAAGDIFQANLSQRVSAGIMRKNPWDLYRTLRAVNPSPFAAFIDYGDYQIVSSSPERLLRVTGSMVETRPIAGTRPRGRDTNEDALMREELLLNEKERAEHIMLIDLERNDLGRVSSYGTVRVDEFMFTEEYSHVIHIVSNITGNLANGKNCFDAVRATFPGGTITGVPKVRCMEIIDELEPLRRGPYTGSAGYLSFSGALDFNIIIRTFIIKNNTAYVHAGAGIVADSDPDREYGETLNKAEALVKTLELVQATEI